MPLSVADLVIQGIILLLTFVHPWFLKLGQGSRAFSFPFLVMFFWGIWRFAYFDPVTRNDIPGIGYLLAPLILGCVARTLYSIRCIFLRWRETKLNASAP